jgi:hypothetical protein
MALFNVSALKQMVIKWVHEAVIQELAKRGNTVNQKMFNRKSAAKYLGVSGTYIDHAVSEGWIDPTFPGDGRTKFYLREDLDKFAESGKSYLKRVEK